MRRRALAGALALALVGLAVVPQAAEAVPPAEPFDFDGNGYADLASGVPGESIGSVEQAGAIQVVYGTKRGLASAGAQLWSRASVGVDGGPSSQEHLGRGVASADFDRDGYADVAALTCTQVVIIYGSRVGLGNRHEFLTSPVPKTRCDRLEDPQGLKALVTGDFNRDSHADLAVTASVPARVFVFMGNDQAIDRNPTVSFSKDPPTTERDYVDYVGNGLAAGDVDGDGDDDLAVGTGIAWIDVTATGVGTIPGFYIVPGSDAGLQVGERRFVHGQRTARLRPKRAEISQSFGHALAIADFDRDGFGDIAVADPEGGRDAGNCELGPCSGAVFILRGSKHGPVVRGRQYWSLSTQLPWGGDDDYAVGNNFGAKLAVGDLDRDGHLDLAIAAPYDQSNYGRPGIHAAAHEWRDVGKVFPNPGNVYVLYGTKNGLSRTGLQNLVPADPRCSRPGQGL